MTTQKIFGLLVSGQKSPIIEETDDTMQCFLCGFAFKKEDSLVVFVNEELTDRRQIHAKCIENHLKLLPDDTKIALVNNETNEVLTYTTASEKA